MVLRVQIDSSSDVLQAEQLARNLRGALREIPGLEVDFAPQRQVEPKAKGAEILPTLLVSFAGAKVTIELIRLLTTRIKEQTKRAKNRTVHLALDDITYDVAGMGASEHADIAQRAFALLEQRANK